MIAARARAIGLCLLFAGSCASSQSSQPPQQAQLTRAVSPPQRLSPPEDLPVPARELLHTRMAAHAHDMGDLMSAIMILDYPRIESGAESIVAEPSFARPLPGETGDLNSALPEKFFALQDELKARATDLAAAAAKQGAFAVADSYGKLSETCVKCHATYRAGR